MGKLSVVVGGQYGSEAKGAVAAWLTKNSPYGNVTVVRVAGPNAGHTAYDGQGRAWALRQIPVGMVSNLDARGVIGDGSEIDLPVLLDEILALENAGIPILPRLAISPLATFLTEAHHHREQDLGMHKAIGSTAKGIGAARADRIMRVAKTYHTMGCLIPEFYQLHYPDRWREDQLNPDFVDLLYRLSLAFSWSVTGAYLADALDGHVIIEGTQGYGLGLHRIDYPRVTSSDTRAIDFLAMAGLNPWHHKVTDFEVWVVVRAYPIRVAGDSGPLYKETTWSELGLAEELTTVTKKVRRVGLWDQSLFDAAVIGNGGSSHVRVAYSMADQETPALAGVHGVYDDELKDKLTKPQRLALEEIRTKTRGLAHYIGTGPNSQIWTPQSIRRRSHAGWAI